MEPSKELDQDLVVAEGAAVATEREFGGLIKDPGPGVINVVARTIGVEVWDEEQNEFAPLIEQDARVPAENSEAGFTTTEDNQDEIKVKILEGESDFAADNDELGSFVLQNIEDAPEGEPNFEITFKIDDEGVLHAEAKDLETNATADTTLDIGMSEIEIEEGIEKKKKTVPAIR